MGIEEHGGPAEVEAFRSTVLARQTDAEEAFVTKWGSRTQDGSLVEEGPGDAFGAIGMSQSGWDKLSKTFTWVWSPCWFA